LTFDHNFGKCRPIFKILSLTDFDRNSIKITAELLLMPSKLVLDRTEVQTLKLSLILDQIADLFGLS